MMEIVPDDLKSPENLCLSHLFRAPCGVSNPKTAKTETLG